MIGRPHVSNFKNQQGVKTRDLANIEDEYKFNQYTLGVDWNATTGQVSETNLEEDMFQFGLDASINFDISIGYRAIFFWMFKNNNDWLVINPIVFGEVASHSWLGLKLGVLEIYARLDGTGYRATPVEYQATWNLNDPAQYCHTMGFL